MKKEFKGFICGIVLTALLGCSAGAVGTWDNISVLRNDIKIVVNGSEIAADNFLYNDTTYLPLRAVSEALNQVVAYDENTNIAYIGERRNDLDTTITHICNLIEGLDDRTARDHIIVNENISYISVRIIPNFFKLDYSSDIDNDGNLICIIKSNNGDITVYPIVFNDALYIPYDTFVDEILPFVE